MMMTVYIAGKFSRREELRKVAQQLLPLRWAVTSRWIWEDEADFSDVTALQSIALAKRDIEDINSAQALIIETTDELSQGAGGGREFELGYATAMGKKTIRIGPARNVFHYSTDRSFHSWSEFIEGLKQFRGGTK